MNNSNSYLFLLVIEGKIEAIRKQIDKDESLSQLFKETQETYLQREGDSKSQLPED